MRGSIVSILLAGGMLAVGACSTTTGQRADATPAEECGAPASRLFPTGRETGEPRQDFRCQSVHARSDMKNSNHARVQRAHAVNRSLARGQ